MRFQVLFLLALFNSGSLSIVGVNKNPLFYKNSKATVKYILSKDGGLGIDINLDWHEKQKLVKLGVPSAFGAFECIGEHPYGRETLKTGLDESVSQKYIALCSDSKAILSVNRGSYGSSFDEKNGILYITLLRSSSYTAHPIGDRIVMPDDRSMPYIDLGEREFSFRFTIGEKEKVLDSAARDAQHFNMQPMLLSFYPNGEGATPASPINLTGGIITLNAFKKAQCGSGYIIRLHNPTDRRQTATLDIMGSKKQIEFEKFEIRTFRYLDGEILSCDLMEGLLD